VYVVANFIHWLHRLRRHAASEGTTPLQAQRHNFIHSAYKRLVVPSTKGLLFKRATLSSRRFLISSRLCPDCSSSSSRVFCVHCDSAVRNGSCRTWVVQLEGDVLIGTKELWLRDLLALSGTLLSQVNTLSLVLHCTGGLTRRLGLDRTFVMENYTDNLAVDHLARGPQHLAKLLTLAEHFNA